MQNKYFYPQFFSQKNLNSPKFGGENLHLKDISDASNLELILNDYFGFKKKRKFNPIFLTQ